LGLPIHWQLFVRVQTAAKARSLTERLAEMLGPESHVAECEQYWKDASLFRVSLTSRTRAEDLAASVLETLQVGAQLAPQWTVGPPQYYEGGGWEFTGSADERAISVPGVVMVDFQVGHLQPLEECRRVPDVRK
jgi:hypothetical protein